MLISAITASLPVFFLLLATSPAPPVVSNSAASSSPLLIPTTGSFSSLLLELSYHIRFRFCGFWEREVIGKQPYLRPFALGGRHLPSYQCPPHISYVCFYWIHVIFHVMFVWWLKYCRLWETYLVLLVFYTAWVSPFEFGFLEQKIKGPLAITDNVVNGFFAIDIVLTFFVAYLDKTSYLLVDNPKQIAWRYTRTWLLFDVISTIPYELARTILPSSLEAYGYFNLLRLWRLRRVSKMFSR